MSQSLPLFRAFQPKVYVVCLNPQRQTSRNPFHFLGHFNEFAKNLNLDKYLESQSLPLFRAFQQKRALSLANICTLQSQSLPLFRAFQQKRALSLANICTLQSQSLPLFRAFQLDIQTGRLYVYIKLSSQSLPLFRAFQQKVRKGN